MSEKMDDISAIRRYVELLVRLKLEDARDDRSQKDMIFLLDACGCSPSEIATLLNTTPNSVSPVLSRGRAKSKRVQKEAP
jgi:DNA-directed RNA polymerase specialized sigma24 family protein